MAVKAGSFNNPEDLPGLAHFCEHMLFLGSKKYPKPDGFDAFLNSNGGSTNAYTDVDVTVYHGDYQSSATSAALERVADIFTEPTFDPKHVDKEVHAINSEHEKNVQSPGWRVHDTVNALASPASPVSRFATGDLQTLSVEPKKKGIDPVERLKAYFADFYCPEQMILVTYGPESLGAQINETKQDFGKMPKGKANCAVHPSATTPNPWPANRMSKFVVIKGTTPSAMLRLVFPFPDLEHDYTQGVQRYFSHLIGYSGVGGLSRTLQDHLGLTTSIGVSFSTSSAGSLMNVYAELTGQGRANVELVLDEILAYLAIMKIRGPDMGVYKSLQNSSKLLWDWPSLHSPAETVSTLARVATVVPPDQLLSAGKRIDKLDPALLKSLMQYVEPANLNIIYVEGAPANLTSAPGNTAGVTFSKLPHYGVEYYVQDIKTVMPTSLDKWISWLNGSLTEAKITEAVVHATAQSKIDHNKTPTPVFPKPLEGIPTNISLKNMKAAKVTSTSSMDLKLFGPHPLLTQAKKALPKKGFVNGLKPQLFYREGWMTKSPFATFVISFRAFTSDNATEVSPTESVLITLYSRLFAEMITPHMAGMNELGLDFGVSVGTTSVRFVFTGFMDLIPKLAEKVLGFFNKFNSDANMTEPAHFARVKTSYRQELSSYTRMPVSYAIGDLATLMQKSSHSKQELLKALQNTSVVNIKSMAGAATNVVLSKPLQLTSLVMGNVNMSKAQEVVSSIAGGVAVPPTTTVSKINPQDSVQLVPTVVQIVKPVELRLPNPRAEDPNDVVVVRVMYGVADVQSRVILGILGELLQYVAFFELRTTRQLGYVVSGGTSMIGNVLYVSCVVQGTAEKADVMESMIEYVYSVALPAKLENMTLKEFETHRNAFKQKLIQPPSSIKEEMNHWLASVMKEGHCFGLRDSMLAYASSKEVNVQALKDTWTKLMVPASGVRNKTVMKVFAGKPPKRPTAAEAANAATKAKVSNTSAALLAREYEAVVLLEKADTSAREQLVNLGGFYPKTLHCGDPDDLKTTAVAAAAGTAASSASGVAASGSTTLVVAKSAAQEAKSQESASGKTAAAASTTSAAAVTGATTASLASASTGTTSAAPTTVAPKAASLALVQETTTPVASTTAATTAAAGTTVTSSRAPAAAAAVVIAAHDANAAGATVAQVVTASTAAPPANGTAKTGASLTAVAIEPLAFSKIAASPTPLKALAVAQLP
eukprot:TRINITY_DN2243_c0_g1_i2.p1 TRINITY_DN2243_c0_g1~~TRINITY_DN2243_c0_g1_i2.p1  ORF type:complete len:1427 (-),score=268.76 TRINITY_DN2243_c0_g1_i2:389-4045(-)